MPRMLALSWGSLRSWLQDVRAWLGALPSWTIPVFGLGLLLRMAFVIGQLQLHVFNVNFNAADSALYRTLGQSLFDHGYFATAGHPTAYVTPGYPLMLALLFTVSHATLFIALVQSVMGAITCVLLASIAQRMAGTRGAWGAGLGAAVYPHLIFWTGYVLTETLYVFGVAVSLVLLARTIERPSPGRGLATGLVFGATALVRPTLLGFLLLLIAGGLLIAPLRVATLVMAAGLALSLAPWVIRNKLVLNSFVVGSTETGQVLYQGNSPGANGGSGGYVGAGDFKDPPLSPHTTEIQSYHILLRSALRWMRDHPGRVLSLAPRKLWNMFRPTYAGASALDKLFTYATYPLLLVLGLVGLLMARRAGPLGWVLIAFMAYHLVFHALVTGMIRFRLPLEAVLMVGAGCAAARLFGRVAKLRERRRGHVLAAPAGLVD
jgi:hypothetical protein